VKTALALILAVGCSTGAWHTVKLGVDRWGPLGCEGDPSAATTISGVLERADPSALPKTFSGERLTTADGERWVLSYGHSASLDRYMGNAVMVEGFECEKLGQAVIGRHFDALRIRLVEDR